jgi:hypothetical protein
MCTGTIAAGSEALTAVVMNSIFLDILWYFTDVSERHTVSIFKVEVG